MRKRSHKTQQSQANFSPSAEGYSIPHRVCPETGKYRGKQVLTIEADE
ncbi:MAG: 50S ribosomal protein L32 [Verrucomicrobia bacterium]|nr:50S ribosomal protein L32 [Verrucomicrobiota bacterium]